MYQAAATLQGLRGIHSEATVKFERVCGGEGAAVLQVEVCVSRCRSAWCAKGDAQGVSASLGTAP